MTAMKRIFYLAALLVALSLVVMPGLAGAASFTFGGDNLFKVKSKGNIDPWLAEVNGSSAGGGDAVVGQYGGLYNFNLWQAIGTSKVSVGDTFEIDYAISDQKRVLNPNFYVTSDFFRKQGPDKSHLPNSFDLSASLNLTSVSFTAPYEIVLRGYLSDVFIDQTTGSAVLSDMAGTGNLEFLMTIRASDKTSGDFISVLQSKKGSTWASFTTTITGGGSGAVPEPGTMLLLGSGLAGLAGWRTRRTRRTRRRKKLS